MRRALLVSLLLTTACSPSASSWNRKGFELAQAGRYADAVAAYGKAVEINPGLADAHYNMGLNYLRLRHPDQAAACFRKALDLQPGDVEASRGLTLANRALANRLTP